MRAKPANMRQARGKGSALRPTEAQGNRSRHPLVIKERKHRMIVEVLCHAYQIGGGSIKLNPLSALIGARRRPASVSDNRVYHPASAA